MSDAAGLYRALLSSGRLAKQRRLTYRCAADRCTLLDVVETPLGIVLHQIRFKQSHGVNQVRSSEGGRRKNTYDGDNHWRPRTYWLSESALNWPDDAGGQDLICDHVGVPDVILRGSEFHADWTAGHAEVRVRADGSRYAVQ